MKKVYLKNDISKKLAAYSALATTAALLGTQADAQVVHSDITDVTVDTSNALIGLDMDGNGTTDFLFNVIHATPMTSGGASNVWSFGRVFGWIPSYSYGSSINQAMGYSGPILPYVSALNNGALISSGQNFIANSSNEAFIASTYNGVTYGALANADHKFMGVQFSIGGTTHYGWIRVSTTIDPVSITIHDLAYDAAANAIIHAGDTTGGGAAIHNLLTAEQVQAYSYGNTVNVIVKNLNATSGTVTVYNTLGEIVYTNALNLSGMHFDLNNVATGEYLLKIDADGAMFNKNLYIQQ